jgi:hypothetical protein
MEGGGSGDKRPKKFEEGWKPTRGGKRAKKQQLLAEAFVAKQQASKASGGDPEDVKSEEFPDFKEGDRVSASGSASSGSRAIPVVPVPVPKTPPKDFPPLPAPRTPPIRHHPVFRYPRFRFRLHHQRFQVCFWCPSSEGNVNGRDQPSLRGPSQRLLGE